MVYDYESASTWLIYVVADPVILVYDTSRLAIEGLFIYPLCLLNFWTDSILFDFWNGSS